MKQLLIAFFLLLGLGTHVHAQQLVTVRDSVYNFTIGVPEGWQYGVPVNKAVAFMALRNKAHEQDLPRENFNINIIRKDEKGLEGPYKMLVDAISTAEGFKLLEEGRTTINGRDYKYLVETHKNKISKEDMTNYVLITNSNGDILILTLVTVSANFAAYEPLFKQIAASLVF